MGNNEIARLRNLPAVRQVAKSEIKSKNNLNRAFKNFMNFKNFIN